MDLKSNLIVQHHLPLDSNSTVAFCVSSLPSITYKTAMPSGMPLALGAASALALYR
jgi:hypothetical protein